MTTKNRTDNIIVLVLFFVVMIIPLTWIAVTKQQSTIINLEVGDTAPQTITAPKNVIYESESQTEERRKQARNEVDILPTIDKNAVQNQTELINATKEQLVAIANSEDEDITKIQLAGQLLGVEVDESQVNEIIQLVPDIDVIFSEVTTVLVAIQEEEQFTSENLDTVKPKISSKINPSLSPQQFAAVKTISEALLIPNSSIDENKQLSKEEAAAEDVSSAIYKIEKDEVIAAQGQEITEEVFEKLEAAGIRSRNIQLQEQIGLLGLIAISTALMLFYMRSMSEAKVHQVALYTIIAISAISLGFAAQYFLAVKPIVLYMLPVAAPAVVIGMTAGIRAGVLTLLYFSIMTALLAGESFEIAIVHIAIGLFTIFALQRTHQIKEIAKTFVGMTLLQSAIAITFHLIAGAVTITKAATLVLASGMFAAGTLAMIIVLLIGISYFFNIATFPALLDLANPSSTLLRKLSIEAPGTYHHSLIVGALAEQAAKAIGADPLLAKVGAYYHDIGKLNNPMYYIENGEKIPKSEDPKKAAKKIISHVSYGIELAKKYKLPKEVKQVIQEHHGTSIVLYFFNKSKSNNQDDFRYPGPRPQTKESAVIMLADTVEAYVRSTAKNQEVDIKKAIEDMVQSKLEDGQLREATITLREIEVIKKAFNLVLKGVYHDRIKY